MDEPDNQQTQLTINDLDLEEQIAYYLRLVVERLKIKGEINPVSAYTQIILGKLEKAKPNDRSMLDRYFAITITDIQKISTYFDYYFTKYPFTNDGRYLSILITDVEKVIAYYDYYIMRRDYDDGV